MAIVDYHAVEKAVNQPSAAFRNVEIYFAGKMREVSFLYSILLGLSVARNFVIIFR